MGRGHDNEKEHHGEDELGQETGIKFILSGRVIAISVLSKALGDVEAGCSACDGVENGGGGGDGSGAPLCPLRGRLL